MAARIFVIFGTRRSQARSPERRPVWKAVRPDAGEHQFGNADLRDLRHAAMRAPGQEQVTGLQTEERNGPRRPDCDPRTSPVRP